MVGPEFSAEFQLEHGNAEMCRIQWFHGIEKKFYFLSAEFHSWARNCHSLSSEFPSSERRILGGLFSSVSLQFLVQNLHFLNTEFKFLVHNLHFLSTEFWPVYLEQFLSATFSKCRISECRNLTFYCSCTGEFAFFQHGISIFGARNYGGSEKCINNYVRTDNQQVQALDCQSQTSSWVWASPYALVFWQIVVWEQCYW